MKRYSILLLLLFALTGGMRAELVTQKQAKRVASEFFDIANGRKMAEPRYVYNGRELTTHRLFAPFYVFNFPAGGFVIVPADNKAMPILAYDLKEPFRPEKLSLTQKELLRQYAWDIERSRYLADQPYEAIAAWGALQDYFKQITSAPYLVTDPKVGPEDRQMMADNVIFGTEAERLSSDIYTPSQWTDMVDIEMDKNGTLVAALITRDEVILPIEIHGRRADLYRIDFGNNEWNNTFYRLRATELLNDNQIAALGYTIDLPVEPEPEYVPFTLYTDFLAENQAREVRRQKAIEEALIVTEPVVHYIGAGKYMVDMPEEVREAFVYNINGSIVKQHTYKGVTSASIDISIQPQGFYFVKLVGISGKPYGIKLVR